MPTLDALLASRHQVVGVVTQPDRPRGRGQKIRRRAGQGARRRRRRAGAAAGALEGPGVSRRPSRPRRRPRRRRGLRKNPHRGGARHARLGMINVHASLLPRYRGAAPVHRAVIAGDRETGVTIMRVVKALDAGPMLATAHRADRRRTRPATRSNAIWRASAPRCWSDRRRARGRRRVEEVPQDDRGCDLRAPVDERRWRRRLDARPPTRFTTRSAACTRGRTPSRSSAASG